ncbi:MAG: diphthine--ammonia ligase [Candidatus Aenigmatarchaeota archaeon]
MKLAVLFTGGKDSTLALIKAKKENEISCLITMIPENKESFMFHAYNIEFTKYQAEAMNIPIIYGRTKGEKEKEVEDLKEVIKRAKENFGIEGVVSGAIRSNYQYSRIEKICKQLNLKNVAPLWQMDEIEELKEVLNEKIKAIIVSVSAYPLTKDFLGKEINEILIEKFKEFKEKFGFNPSGEGGEYETFVLDAPIFEKKIKIEDFEIVEEENSAYMKIKKVSLNDKLL